jgi:hypothetical protein
MFVSWDSFRKTWSLLRAVVSGETVSEERMRARIEICSTCPYIGEDSGGRMKCSVCGCRLSGDGNLVDLARYEETKEYGCKHDKGSQWKKNGV